MWQVEDKTILVRMKSQGQVFDENNKVNNVCLCSKLKYYYSIRYEKLTSFEQCKDLVDILMQPTTFKIYRFRICPLKQKVVPTNTIKNFAKVFISTV